MKDFSEKELRIIQQALTDRQDAVEREMRRLEGEMFGEDVNDAQRRYFSNLLEAFEQEHIKLYRISAKIDARLTSIT
jgi:hypothetical protein